MSASNWHEALQHCYTHSLDYVLVTVISVTGSTPREAGAKMVITSTGQYDTIGGGHLEFVAIAQARKMLTDAVQAPVLETFALSARLGQCCGGAAKILFEANYCPAQPLTVFGAGHVARALIPIIAQLPLAITWVDSRTDAFDGLPAFANVRTEVEEDPRVILADLPGHSWLLILTHNHQIDYTLVETALRNHDFGFVGMIGSATKAKRFGYRLAQRGMASSIRQKLITPVGRLDIPGKRPVEVAVSISAQLITLLHQPASDPNSPNGLMVKEENHDT